MDNALQAILRMQDDRIRVAVCLARWVLSMDAMSEAEAEDFDGAYRCMRDEVEVEDAFWDAFDQLARLMRGFAGPAWRPAIERCAEAPGYRRTVARHSQSTGSQPGGVPCR